MSTLRTLLVATWIVWGALLPIVGGIFIAVQLNIDLGYGALAGGLVALPLAIAGLRLADAELLPVARSDRELSSDERYARSIKIRDQVVMLLMALGLLGLGVAGLVRGSTVILLPSHASNSAGGWTVPGPGGAIVAIGLVLMGLALLIYRGRPTEQEHRSRFLLLAGLFSFVLGHVIYGLGLLLVRIAD